MTRIACALLAASLRLEQAYAEDANITTVERINSRFANGTPSSSLDSAGVVIHSFDGLEGHADGSQKWMPCMESWCLKFSDRWSASVINAHDSAPSADGKINLFNHGGGFILSPQVELLCSYSHDGGTMTKWCSEDGSAVDGCVPGCECPNDQESANCTIWCDELGRDYNCAFRPNNLDEMMTRYRETQSPYNEVVIAAGSKWTSELPGDLEATFFVGDDDCTNETKTCEEIEGCPSTRDFHTAFLNQFGITSEDSPLLCLDRGDFQTPFVDVSARFGQVAVDNKYVVV